MIAALAGDPGELAQQIDSLTWDSPDPFEKPTLPPFPVEVLPPWGRDKVEAVRDALQVPADLPAMLTLDMFALACGGKVEIEVVQGWREPTNLFTAVAMLSGERKTPAVDSMTGPALRAQSELHEAMASEIAAATNKKKIMEAALERARKAAVGADGDERDRLTADAETLAQELATMNVPAAPRLLADDCTQEQLARMLAQQQGRLAVISDEGGIFDMMAGRYTKNGAPNIDVYLKAHNGSPLHVDRIGREALFVARPALTIGLAVQPDVIAGLASKPGFRGRGLLPRFLYSLPASKVGSRASRGAPEPVPVKARYEEGMLALLRMEWAKDGDGRPTPRVLVCAPDAADALYGFLGWIEPQLGPFGALRGISDWAGKLPGAVARIAALLHVGTYGPTASWTKSVDAATMHAAISIGSYLIPHARATFGLMGADPHVEHARHLLRWIERNGKETFTRRDLHQGVRGTFRQAEELIAPLRVLVSRVYIRPVAETEPREPGRPSHRFEVNPLWLGSGARDEGSSEDSEDCVYESEDRIASWGRL